MKCWKCGQEADIRLDGKVWCYDCNKKSQEEFLKQAAEVLYSKKVPVKEAKQ